MCQDNEIGLFSVNMGYLQELEGEDKLLKEGLVFPLFMSQYAAHSWAHGMQIKGF